MKWLWTALATTISLTASVLGFQEKATTDRVVRQDLQRIQGEWCYESVEEDGEQTPAAQLKGRTLFFGGDTFVVRQDRHITQAGALKLDPSKPRPAINVMVKEGLQQGDILLGIYQIDADTLRLCFDTSGERRPTEFKTAQKSQTRLSVLKRIKSAVDDQVPIAGKYTSENIEIDGSKVLSQVRIERRGDAYLVTYSLNNVVAYVGTGIRTGDTLSVCWATQGHVGVSAYRIEKGPKLVGRYTSLGSHGLLADETLTYDEPLD